MVDDTGTHGEKAVQIHDWAEVVVIGAGRGGRATAVAAVRRGRRLVAMERGENPGRHATCFERGRFGFGPSLHALEDLASGVGIDGPHRELVISDRVLAERPDPLHLARFPDGDIAAVVDRFP